MKIYIICSLLLNLSSLCCVAYSKFIGLCLTKNKCCPPAFIPFPTKIQPQNPPHKILSPVPQNALLELVQDY